MPPARRSPVPTAIRDALLFRNDHTCCVCNDRSRDVQIHHIDSNPANNTPDNLAVLCLDCHSRATGPRGLGQTYQPGEIRKYKRAWEQKVDAWRRVHRPVRMDAHALAAQVDLLVCEILAAGGDVGRATRLLDVLYNLNLWRGDRILRKRIVDGLSHLAIMTGLDRRSTVAPLVAEKLWEMCWHFAGPHEVPMDREDERHVISCVEALASLAVFTCMTGHGKRALEATLESAENLFQVGLWYRRDRIIHSVLRLYRRAREDCGANWASGPQILSRSLRRLMRFSQEGQAPRRICAEIQQSLVERRGMRRSLDGPQAR